ncbi:hypothetical protein LP065_10330 [Latilactobacillus sakei]|uniref:hypothetical protein n=1 Tax=Latilactobacillus sakei TaxID=1599 RepID=UPI000A17AA43|nr:hypothetical protein [Latilactobacillus sakei]ARJ72852.1 hypothetical protein LP065_10080 [Latilactobacillus sakei]ARJ72900.1 hypothetical protein LP065_10330 [Latilactobacillus sakei]
MTKNKLEDLNNHLFEQLERLNDDDLTDEQIKSESKRASAMAEISEQIIKNAGLALKAIGEYNVDTNSLTTVNESKTEHKGGQIG